MNIRARRPDDDDAIDRLTRSAFAAGNRGHHGEAELVLRLRADGDAAIELVADMPGGLIGHVVLSPMRAPEHALGLGPISVHPDHWGQGIGAALMRAAIAAAEKRAAALIFLLGDPAFYGRFGFTAEAADAFRHDFPNPYFQALRLRPDAPVTGSAIYAAAFDGAD
ncbi:MAG: N-acetyltransferase [Pseudomonadota bacterium]